MMTHNPERPTAPDQQERKGQANQADLNSADPYAVLGLKRHASLSEIKHAYFNLVRQYSPETNPEAFKQIRTAYEKLNNAESKTETDLFLFQTPPPWEARKHRRKLELDFDPQEIWLLLLAHGDLGRNHFEDDFREVQGVDNE